jgi:tRNA dimethylallyltransferase
MADSGGGDGIGPGARIPIVVIGGPTASGKSSLAIELARRYDAEVISADSRQIYRQLRIGTDRLTPDDWHGIRHHLMGTVDLDERFTVFDFVRQATDIIEKVSAGNRHSIVCGGTGLYIRALVDGIFEIPDEDMSYRNELLDIASTRGPKHLYEMLVKVDPQSAEEIHPHNVIRVVRALEIYRITGRRKSELKHEPGTRNKRFMFLQLTLVPPRQQVYNRIDARVDQMVNDGLFEEAEAVYNSKFGKALRERKVVGYAEVGSYFEGEMSRDEAIRLIKQNTRRFAKRQYTWFRSVKAARFLECFGSEAGEPAAKLAGEFWSKNEQE